MNSDEEKCIWCMRSSDEIPLILLSHQGKTTWICPAHLPILIHKPEQLADRLPGAAKLDRAEDHHHD